MSQTPGEQAYARYGAVTEGRTHDGREMLPWDRLPSRIKAGWEAAGTVPAGQTSLVHPLCREQSPSGELCDALFGHTPAGQHSWAPLPEDIREHDV